jgi:hypothetical protein
MGLVGERALDVGWTYDDGIRIVNVGSPLDPTSEAPSEMLNGIEIGVTRGHGIFIGKTEAGGMHIRETTNNGIYVDSAGISGMHVRKAEYNGFAIGDAGQHGLYVQDAGGDGVHVANATGWAGYFDGDVKSEGDLWADSYQVNSDRRLKRNIRPITKGLTELLAFRPVEFEWKRRSNEGTRLGLIAQEVQEIVPEAVKAPDSMSPFYSIDYDELVPILIRAVQEQQEAIDRDHATIERLEHELRDLRRQVPSLVAN